MSQKKTPHPDAHLVRAAKKHFANAEKAMHRNSSTQRGDVTPDCYTAAVFAAAGQRLMRAAKHAVPRATKTRYRKLVREIAATCPRHMRQAQRNQLAVAFKLPRRR